MFRSPLSLAATPGHSIIKLQMCIIHGYIGADSQTVVSKSDPAWQQTQPRCCWSRAWIPQQGSAPIIAPGEMVVVPVNSNVYEKRLSSAWTKSPDVRYTIVLW